MTTITEKIKRLQSLLEHKGEEKVPPLGEPRADRSAQVPQVEEVVDAVFPGEPPVAPTPKDLKQLDPDQCPPSLEGLSYGDILLLQTDGALTEAEEEWISYKNVPNPDGSFRMPNIKFLSRRKDNGKLQVR